MSTEHRGTPMTTASGNDRLDDEQLRRFRDRAAALTAGGRVPGLSVAVTRHDRPLYSAGFGAADLGTGRAATDRTDYLWFSMSKIATATAALRLADEGRLDLAAPIVEYVPGYRARTPSVQPRIGQLLNHTAGVANPPPIRWVRPADRPAPDPAELLARRLARHGRPKYPVGQQARYSNLGYLILAEAVARAAEQPFTDYVRAQVLEPAGMTTTGYAYVEGADRAVGYVRTPRLVVPAFRAVLPPGIVGDRHGAFQAFRPFLVDGPGYGGLVGNVVEAARLAALHLADGSIGRYQVLRPETARAMRDIRSPGRPFDLGQGWFRKPEDAAASPSFVEHLGSGGGFFNAMRLYPELDLGMVVMANTTAAYDYDGLFDLLRRVSWGGAAAA